MSIDEEGRPCVRVDGYESAFTWDEYREVRPLLKLQITMKTLHNGTYRWQNVTTT